MTSTPPHTPREFQGLSEITAFIWSVADLLRGDYKQADYGKVILPFTILRRLDCVLDKTREKVLQRYEALKGGQVKNLELRGAGEATRQQRRSRSGTARDESPPREVNLKEH
jgi:type I restriction enzyme M protein